MFFHEEDTPTSPAPDCSSLTRMRKWYDTAIFFLEKADYLRVPTLKTVQTIAILGIVFNNVGEFHFHANLWAVAIRIAQTIKIDDERSLAARPAVEREVCRRVWWTLIICDWSMPPHLSYSRARANSSSGYQSIREIPLFWSRTSKSTCQP